MLIAHLGTSSGGPSSRGQERCPRDSKYDRPDRHIELLEPLQNSVAVELPTLGMESPSRHWQLAASHHACAKDLCYLVIQERKEVLRHRS